jgi:hypothetical protein
MADPQDLFDEAAAIGFHKLRGSRQIAQARIALLARMAGVSPLDVVNEAKGFSDASYHQLKLAKLGLLNRILGG